MTHPAPATLYLFTNPAFQGPEPEDVRAVIQLLDLTADQVANLVGVKDGRAVRRWLAPATSKTHAKIDYATWRLLLLEAGLVRLQKRRGASSGSDAGKSEKRLRQAKQSRKRPVLNAAIAATDHETVLSDNDPPR